MNHVNSHDSHIVSAGSPSSAENADSVPRSAPGAESNNTASSCACAANDSVVRFIADFITSQTLEILCDGAIIKTDLPVNGQTLEDAKRFLAAPLITDASIIAQLRKRAFDEGLGFPKDIIVSTWRKIVQERQAQRRRDIILPLIDPDNMPLELEADHEWRQYRTLFAAEFALADVVTKHWMWVVKRKVLNLPVSNHLMLIFYDRAQGGGKTTVVHRLLAPLKELASGDILLSEFLAPQSAELFQTPVLFIDDMPKITKILAPLFKQLLTADRMNRRKLFTSYSAPLRMVSSLIATSNMSVRELIPDDAHRRFVEMPFRNGNAAKGGDESVWETVNSLNYDVLWRSVNAYEQSPITGHLAELHEYQNQSKPLSPMLHWLLSLDVDEEAVRRITSSGGVQADALHRLYMTQTQEQISRNSFSEQMLLHCDDERSPFAGRKKRENGNFYLLRRPLRFQSYSNSPRLPEPPGSEESSGSSGL